MPNVTVACKIPNGVVLEVTHPRELAGGGWATPLPEWKAKHIGKRVTVGGPKFEWGTPKFDEETGYILTDVDEDFWNAWMKANSGLTMVEKKFIFASVKSQDARAQSRELAELKTGIEPLTPPKESSGGVETFHIG